MRSVRKATGRLWLKPGFSKAVAAVPPDTEKTMDIEKGSWALAIIIVCVIVPRLALVIVGIIVGVYLAWQFNHQLNRHRPTGIRKVVQR